MILRGPISLKLIQRFLFTIHRLKNSFNNLIHLINLRVLLIVPNENAVVTNVWKHAIISPIFIGKGPYDELDTYRGIIVPQVIA